MINKLGHSIQRIVEQSAGIMRTSERITHFITNSMLLFLKHVYEIYQINI